MAGTTVTWMSFATTNWAGLATADWLGIDLGVGSGGGGGDFVHGNDQQQNNMPAIETPLDPNFKVLGKLIAIRRTIEHEALNTGRVYNYEYFLAHVSAQFAQVGYKAFTDTWLSNYNRISTTINQIGGFTTQLDNLIKSYLQTQIMPLVGANPHAALSAQLETLVAYMQAHGMIVPSGDLGFYAYFNTMFKDRFGHPIQLPASSTDVYGNGWVTTDLVN